MDEPKKLERAGVIKIVCLFGLIAIFSTLRMLFSQTPVVPFGPTRSYYLVVLPFLALSLLGLWLLKKWGVYLYTLVAVSNFVALFLTFPIGIIAFPLVLVLIFCGFFLLQL